MREILISFVLLFSLSLSVFAEPITTISYSDVYMVEANIDIVANTATTNVLLYSRLCNVTGENTHKRMTNPGDSDSQTKELPTLFSGISAVHVEVGWQST